VLFNVCDVDGNLTGKQERSWQPPGQRGIRELFNCGDLEEREPGNGGKESEAGVKAVDCWMEARKLPRHHNRARLQEHCEGDQ
jgi:hypothetical protein